MTLCGAAIAAGGYIVSISDKLISNGIVSADGVSTKLNMMDRVGNNWVAMIAGEDITQSVFILDRAAKLFRGKQNTLEKAHAAFKNAYRGHMADMVESGVLGRYKLSMRQFVNREHKLTDAMYYSINEKILTYKAPVQFLVFGFDKEQMPHLFTAVDGLTHSYDLPGFCCIGTGGPLADVTLYLLGQKNTMSLDETVFNLCAAKFMAERAGVGVGQETHLYLQQPGTNTTRWRDNDMLNGIRQIWEKECAPRIPTEAIELIRNSGLACRKEP